MEGARIFAGPAKHSVTISGHETSISLEPLFWEALRRAALEEGVALNTLVARIDEERIAAFARPHAGTGEARASSANLASAIRSWLWHRYCK